MKKLIYFTFLVLVANMGYSQSNNQIEETINTGRVIGSFEIGSNEVTTIVDEIVGCFIKTSPHTKGLFTPNETVQLILKGNQQIIEVRKPLLSEKVYANKNCENENNECQSSFCIIKNDENKLIFRFTDGNYKVFYNASLKANNSIKSNLIIYGGNNGNGAIPTSFYLDKSNAEQYKLFSHRGVIDEANRLLNQENIRVSEIEELLLEKLILSIKNDGSQLTESELAKSIYFHVAIVKTMKRAIENNKTDCDCAPVPLYFVDKTPFLCQQDVKYNVADLLNNLESDSSTFIGKYDSLTFQNVRSYLQKKSLETDFVTFEDSYIELSNGVSSDNFNDVIDDQIELGWCLLGPGSALGCCGNYSGCCWFWNETCLMHDIACWCCKPRWYCFDGCVSGSGC